MTSSHFAGSERQYRFPLGYGGQRTPTAQWTVTGSGAALVTVEKGPVAIESATIGTVTDLGITDAANMGPAMAPVDVTLRPCGGMHFGYTNPMECSPPPDCYRRISCRFPLPEEKIIHNLPYSIYFPAKL